MTASLFDSSETVEKLSALLDHLNDTHTNLVATVRSSEKRFETATQNFDKVSFLHLLDSTRNIRVKAGIFRALGELKICSGETRERSLFNTGCFLLQGMCRWVEGVGCSSRSLIPDPKKRKHK
jgi:hypothetical protein